MRKLFKIFSLMALSLALAGGTAQSASTGKIQGTLTDAQTGEPLPGANVVIDGTQRGAVTDASGYFVILLVDPGTYDMTGSMVGYDSQRQTGVRVQSDFTTTINFSIREASLELGEMVVIAERPAVEPDKTTSKYMMSSEDLAAVPIVRDMGEFLELQAGVSIDAEGDDLMVRGGDREDVAYVIDGVRVGTTDGNGSRTGLGRGVNKSAVQELQVITGGYNAEYGNAQGGVVSMVTRDGGSAFSGLFDYQFTPSGQKHWGKNAYDSALHRGNNKWTDPAWVAQSIEIPADLNGDGFNDIIQAHQRLDYTGEMGHRMEGNVSGPLTSDLVFFLSSRWRKTANAFPDADQTTPFNTSSTAKLTYSASSSVKLRVGGVYDRRDGTFGGPTQGGKLDLRDNGRNLFLSVPSPTGHLEDLDAIYNVGLTHSLSPKTFYEVTLAYGVSSRDTANMTPHFGVAPELTSDRTTDGHYTIYRETTNWDRYSYGRTSLKADLSSQVNKQNFVKTGFEVIRYNNWYQQQWSDGPTNRHVLWFGKDYKSSAFWPNGENKGLNPMDVGIYLQDKIEFEGMIVNAGIRGEAFLQNTWIIDNDNFLGLKAPWNGMTRSQLVPDVKGKAIKSFQPRVGVSHPVTEKSLVRFFYGKFTQRPQFNELFENEFQSNEARDKDLNGNGVLDPAERYNEYNDPGERHGTPYLPPEETTSFEVGLDWNFVGDYVLGLTTYYKASSNHVGGASQQFIDPESAQYVTGGNGYRSGNWKDARGFEMNLRKKFSNMFSFNLGYNLQWVDGGNNASGRRDVWPDSQFVANGWYWVDWDIDPATGAEIPVTLQEKARRGGLAEDFYVIKFGELADNAIQAQTRSIESTGRQWSWIPWYSHYSASGVQLHPDEAPDASEYGDEDKEFWARASAHPGNPGNGEGNTLVGHSQEAGERAPLSADRRSFGSMTFLFATPTQYGPFGGKALGNLRANMVYRLYTGSQFTYSTGGVQGFRYGPIHTRTDFNAEKVLGDPSGVSVSLAVEVYNLFNQQDNRQNALSGRAEDFDSNRYQVYGIMGLEPTNNDIVGLSLDTPELNDVSNYWDSPREMNFSIRIKW
jgi:hypothetical protein